ncbi:MAG: CRISPR-associated helicase Cas3' [Suipraeoptans sp.]
MENINQNDYIAHFREKNINGKNIVEKQSVKEHCTNTANIASSLCELDVLKNAAWCAGMLHDCGKLSSNFRDYINKAMNGSSVKRGEVDHSTAGGIFVEEQDVNDFLKDMLQVAIFSHHGLRDCLPNNGEYVLVEERVKKDVEFDHVKRCVEECFDTDLLAEKLVASDEDIKNMIDQIISFQIKKSTYGNKNFFLGMYERILMSLLIDADRIDTACFMDNKELQIEEASEKRTRMQQVWESCQTKVEHFIDKLPKQGELNKVRKQISDSCLNAGMRNERLFRLSVPTGGGKTLASLRFALSNAVHNEKTRIIYVAPYCKLLDQNAKVIKEAIGDENLVLEYHSNVIFDEDKIEERNRYDLLGENFDVPIVVTTAVQFLYILFKSDTSSVRKMHNLCNSVIIFDEIQSLPIRITELFNLATNFLTTFAQCTMVLCSATQPPNDNIDKNRMLPPVEMVPKNITNNEVFRRTTIIDGTTTINDKITMTNGGIELEEATDFIVRKAIEESQMIVIVNTKKCAIKLYKKIRENQDIKNQGFKLFHISTNMCLTNRREVMEELEKCLNNNEKVICISTSVIEAGVDISSIGGIRSLCGLDHIIQTAGRVNRNGDATNGNLYIIELDESLENTSPLDGTDIEKQIMRDTLYYFRTQPDEFDNTLDSEYAIQFYYKRYYERRKVEMNYPVNINGLSDNLVNLLADNKKIARGLVSKREVYLKQAFKSAGEKFHVIPEDSKIDIIIPYDERAKQAIKQLENKYCSLAEKKSSLRVLQLYTVGISEYIRKELNNAIKPICDNSLLVLSMDYYSKEYGISDSPEMMKLLTM